MSQICCEIEATVTISVPSLRRFGRARIIVLASFIGESYPVLPFP
jgi:hypothetical protein